MNNTQYLTSRIYRPTDRRFLLYGLPLLFAVHPTFTAITALEEPISNKEPNDEVFTSTEAIESAEAGLKDTFTKNLVFVPLAFGLAYPIIRGHARTGSSINQKSTGRSLFSFNRPLVVNALAVVGVVGAFMCVDTWAWHYRLKTYGPEKVRGQDGVTYFRERSTTERASRLVNQSFLPLALSVALIRGSAPTVPFVVGPIILWKLCWHSALVNTPIPEING